MAKVTKQCYFSQNNIKHIDYKDTAIISKFINPQGRIMSRKKTGVSAKNQRNLAVAIKRARFMALLPYVSA
jgi:small subunit ribosomal protein S18